MKVSLTIRKWYRKIGALGGAAGKGTERRRELMRRNIRIRWRTERAELRKIFGRRIPRRHL
jgi:hypothetical protein